VDQVVQDALECLGALVALRYVFDPPAWCEPARTLCSRDVKTPSLSGVGIKVTKGAW
jgi:hypothetical protein